MMQPFSNTVIGEIEQGEPAAPGVLLLEREREREEVGGEGGVWETEIWARFLSKSLGVRNTATLYNACELMLTVPDC